MSQKITSKNLSYDTSLPPFLARLRGQQVPSDRDSPDPILAARRRPTGRTRTASEEAEDAPLVVDEQGNVVDLKVGGEDEEVDGREDTSAAADKNIGRNSDDKVQEKDIGNDAEKSVTFGAGKKKRKAGRVIGADDDAGESKSSKGDVEEKEKQDDKASDPLKGKPLKKKAKKIKLSFGDDEEG